MRAHVQSTNFTAGELTPKAYGRVDIDRYRNAYKDGSNGYPQLYGGFTRRGGFRYAAQLPYNANNMPTFRIIPYVISSASAYVVALNPTQGTTSFAATVFNSSGVQQATSLAWCDDGTTDPFKARYAVDDGILYVTAKPTVGSLTNKLRGIFLAGSTWVAPEPPWVVYPSTYGADIPNTTATLSAASGAITVTAASASFAANDVGRYIRANKGYARITGFTSSTVVSATTSRDFDDTSFASGEWSIEEPIQANLTPSATGPLGASITLTLSTGTWKTTTNGYSVVTHIGKYIEINGGLVETTSHSSATVINGKVRALLSATTAAGANGWFMREPVNGNFNAIGMHEQRMLLANSRLDNSAGAIYWNEPQGVWGSVIGDIADFSIGSNDDDAYQFYAKTETATAVQHLASLQGVIALTESNVFSLDGGTDAAITPTNVRIKSQAAFGANDVRPQRVGNEIIYVQAGGRKVRALGYQVENDAYAAPDISLLAEHLVSLGIVDMAFQKDPDPILWCVTSTGKLLSCTLDREQNVIGWAYHETDGNFESVCVIPVGSTERLFAVVKRNINGTDQRYLEYLDPDRNLDCCVTGSGAPATVWTGLSHLEGETVRIIADGVDVGTKVVSGGQITLDASASAVEIGFLYTTNVKLLRPEIQTQYGTAQASAISIDHVIVRLYQTYSLWVNGNQFTLPGAIPGSVSFTGDVNVGVSGATPEATEVTLSQEQPYAWTVQAVVRKISVTE